jgi:hypothetical protein
MCLAVSGANDFVGTYGGGVFLSTDAGTSWTAVDAGLTNSSVMSFYVSGTNLFCGTLGGGVFLSTNNGASWTAVNSGMTNANVNSLAVSGTNLFAGTQGTGVFRRPLSEMITSVGPWPSELPGEFQLMQNYPNPFNPTTVVRFQLPVASMVRLAVYDILGREVAVLVNERMDAGVHEIKFDGSNLASSVYLYRIQAGDFVQTRKLLLLK